MTISEFIAKWRKVDLKERSAAQEHFIDLCNVFEHPTPATADPTGETFCFEKGAAKHGGGDGFADVWKRGFFGWEYKGRHKDLISAYDQLLRYRNALENPPLLVLCDLDRIIVHTNFTGTVSATHEIPLQALGEPRHIEILRAVFHNPEALRPGRTSTAVTQDAAKRFGDLAESMRKRGHDSAAVAHFLDRIVFCLFAEDTGLLPDMVFTRIVEKSHGEPGRFGKLLAQLFETMATGGDFGLESIRHFNGNLFDDQSALDMTADEIKHVAAAADLDWSAVDPSIFGTLFERGLDPTKRSQLGAHFTGMADIELLVDAVILSVLRREWTESRTIIENLLTTGKKRGTGVPPVNHGQDAHATEKPLSAAIRKKATQEAGVILHRFLTRLQNVTVLDPACGSGNFLYVALLRLKDLEKEAILFGADNGLGAFLPLVGPSQLYGIEINPYAHDLAQMTVWIGWLQWIRVNGFGFPAEPILRPLSGNIRLMDAILNRGTGVPPVDHGQDAHATAAGVNPLEPVNIRRGAYLPHWTQAGATYAVCFRLGDALPSDVLRQWSAEREDIVKTARQLGRDLSDEERQRLATLHSEKVEKWLDSGHGACWLKDERIAETVRGALAHFEGDRYTLLAWCIMPNHVHVILRPEGTHQLPDILHSWKSYTSKEANKLLNRTGEFWQAEYYDHLIRNEDDFRKQVAYVLANPARAGLAEWKWVGRGTGVPPVDHGQDAHATTPREPEWPKVDFIIGNPPFLGGSKIWNELGREYQEQLWQLYKGQVPGGADLCCYWFEKARAHIAAGKCKRAGLLATQGIRGGANREVLKRIKESGAIFWAESDRPWVLDGANVHVSMVAFDDGTETERILDGATVQTINSNLTAIADTTTAQPLRCMANLSFIGTKKAGDFNITEDHAIELLAAPNPHGKPNSDILKPWLNGTAIVQRPDRQWIIDCGDRMSLEDFRLYDSPYQHVLSHVKPKRDRNKEKRTRENWWLYKRNAPDVRTNLSRLHRYIATPRVSKHRVFTWNEPIILPDDGIFIFARSDDYFFGVLHSRFHEVWALKLGTRLETRPRYTPTTCFETFPFPCGTGVPPVNHGQDAHATIAEAAKELNKLRETWLNPPEWTTTEALEFPGTVGGPWDRYIDPATVEVRGTFKVGTVRYPRVVARNADCAARLKDRTLTKLYNERPPWLAAAHEKLDIAVASAYGWPADLTEDAILENLLALNLAAAHQEGGTP